MTSTPIFQFEFLNEADTEKAKIEAENRNWLRCEAIVKRSIIDRDLTTAPAATNGDLYLVPASGVSGVWAGHENELALYYAGWIFIVPIAGPDWYVADEAIWIAYDAAASPPEWAIKGTNLAVDRDGASLSTSVGGLDFTGPGVSVSIAAGVVTVADHANMLSVVSMALTAPPGGEAENDHYIPAATATGAWAGQEGKIARFDGAGWVFYAPQSHWTVINQADSSLHYWDAAASPPAWAPISTGGGGGGVSDGDKGDITVSGSGATWTIDAGAVTLAKMADLATARILGRTTAGTGAPEALTAAQATALLDAFTSSLKGLVPASGGGTTNFLRADGSWAAPAGGGGGGGTLIATTSLSGTPTEVEVTGLSGYSRLQIICKNMSKSALNYDLLQLGDSGGYDTTDLYRVGYMNASIDVSALAPGFFVGPSAYSSGGFMTVEVKNLNFAAPCLVRSAEQFGVAPIMLEGQTVNAKAYDRAKLVTNGGTYTAGGTIYWIGY